MANGSTVYVSLDVHEDTIVSPTPSRIAVPRSATGGSAASPGRSYHGPLCGAPPWRDQRPSDARLAGSGGFVSARQVCHRRQDLGVAG